jgi:2-keto-4-pentenoate hydratase/2-oxohepta-3-ene-1,7-dioic acid hydratase in catechol pathway
MFAESVPTGGTLPLDSVEVQAPCLPTKIIGLWNNFAEAAAKNGLDEPEEPLYFFKPPSTVLAPGGTILRPESYDGRVFFEGELGVVIGKACREVSEAEVEDVVLGYTCVNDATAFEIISEDPSFAQWSRAKSFDTFTPLGPVIATDLDTDALQVTVRMNGKVRQDYPVSDMFFPPRKLVERISRGARPMRPGSTVEVEIDGIGTLTNTFG